MALNTSLWDEDLGTDDYVASTERTSPISADIDMTPTSLTESGDEGATPVDSDASEDGETSDQGAQLLAEAFYDDHGAVTGVSPDGNYAVFAMHTGEVVVYDAEADSFSRVQSGVESQPSHILLQDTGRATVAWMDGHAFGAVDSTEEAEATWRVAYDGSWDVDASDGRSSIAAVTYPDEGPGRVGVTTSDGDMVWDHPLDEAAAESVAITDAGDRAAVGAIGYWTEANTSGTPGVRLYAGQTGDRQWMYKTESNVGTVDIPRRTGTRRSDHRRGPRRSGLRWRRRLGDR